MTMIDLFEVARLTSTPILAIRTADQAATITEIRQRVAEFPLAQWDAARGMRESLDDDPM